MNKHYFNFLCIALALFTLVGHRALALEGADTVIFNGTLWGRSTLDFRPQAKNIQFSIPVGSEAKVLETRQLKGTGSYAIRIQLTRVAGANTSNSPQVGAETWVYFSQKEPWLSLKAADGTLIHDPEIPFKEKAIKEPDPQRSKGVAEKAQLPSKGDVIREQKEDKTDDPNLGRETQRSSTEAGICTHCLSGNKTPEASNRESIKNLHSHLQTLANQPGETSYELEWQKFPEIVQFSNSAEVRDTISYGMRNKHSRAQRLCYRYVKRALQAGGLVQEYPIGIKATQAERDLQKEGFRNLMKEDKYKSINLTTESAPKGSVLVYCRTDGNNRCDNTHPGHVEIKTDWGNRGGFVSDFFRRTDQPLYRRKLIAVMVK